MFLYKNNLTNNKAYNLVITSALVLVMSVIMSSIVGFYNINNIEKRTIETQKKFQAIDIALTKFLIENNRFPCPAPLDCNQEGCDSPKNPIYGASIVGGEKKLGVELVIEKNSLPNISICQAIEDGTFSLENDDQEELIYGTVPVVSLGLDNTYMTDGWGNKIVYIIPISLSNTYLTSENEEYSPIEDILTKDTISYNLSKNGEFVDDGDIFALLSHSSNVSGSYSFNSTKSNSFSNLTGNDAKNMPINKAKVDLEDNRFLKFSKNKMEFDEIRSIKESGDSEPDCPAETILYKFSEEPEVESCIDFEFTGSAQEFIVPQGVDEINVKLWGAEGGYSIAHKEDDRPGKGGYAEGSLAVIPGEKFHIFVGERGRDETEDFQYIDSSSSKSETKNIIFKYSAWNAGGLIAKGVGGGGGATDIRRNLTENPDADWTHEIITTKRIMVAGGGGGGSTSSQYTQAYDFSNGYYIFSHIKKSPSSFGGTYEVFRINNTKRKFYMNKYTGEKCEEESDVCVKPIERGGDGCGIVLGQGKEDFPPIYLGYPNYYYPPKEGFYFTGKDGWSAYGGMPGFGGGVSVFDTRGTDFIVKHCAIPGNNNSVAGGGGGYYNGGNTMNLGMGSNGVGFGCSGLLGSDGTPTSVLWYQNTFHFGPGGGGAGYVSKDFYDLNGACGINEGNGKARICFKKKADDYVEDKNFTFPSVKYGEKSFSKEDCPYRVSENPVSIDDYYTLSNFKDINGDVISNKISIKCGKNGKWEMESSEDGGGYKFTNKCEILPKCFAPNDTLSSDNEWEVDFDVVNLGVVRNIVDNNGLKTIGNKKIQCVVDKNGNAEYYNVIIPEPLP